MEEREYGKAGPVLKQFWSINRGSNQESMLRRWNHQFFIRQSDSKNRGPFHFLRHPGDFGFKSYAYQARYVDSIPAGAILELFRDLC